MSGWFGVEWSRLHRVTDRDQDPWFKSCEDRAGLYRLVGLRDGQQFEPQPLHRVCGIDLTGTIYIGTGASLPGRISDLVKQHDKERFASRGHKALPDRLAKAFPPERLAVCWLYLDETTDNYAEEIKLRADYVAAYGEPPPLNSMP